MSFWHVSNGFSEIPISKETATRRIEEGIARMERGIRSNPSDHPLGTLGAGYKRLMEYTSFLAPNEPTIGTDFEGYFVFTLFPSQDPSESFRQGWAVKKSDGQVYYWNVALD
jgi:hypothetical protein